MLTLCGLRQDLSGVAILPAVLNILSELELVAQLLMYFWAKMADKGYLCWLSPHHIKGSQDASSASSWKNLVSFGSAYNLFDNAAWVWPVRWALLFWRRSLSLLFLVGATALGSSLFPPKALLQHSPLSPCPLPSGPVKSSRSCTSWCLTWSDASASSMLPQYLGSKMVAFLSRSWIVGEL